MTSLTLSQKEAREKRVIGTFCEHCCSHWRESTTLFHQSSDLEVVPNVIYED